MIIADYCIDHHDIAHVAIDDVPACGKKIGGRIWRWKSTPEGRPICKRCLASLRRLRREIDEILEAPDGTSPQD